MQLPARYLVRWEQQRVTLRMLDALRQQVRRGEGRDADPSAGITDSQSVAASVQDRDGAEGTLLGLYLSSPRCRLLFADPGFAGRLVDWADHTLRTTLDIVTSEAMIRWAAIGLMTRRLARGGQPAVRQGPRPLEYR